MNFFYFDQTGQKQGPFSRLQLKELADHKVIGPLTPMETDTGHKGVAGQIPGLFISPDIEQRKKRIVYWTTLSLLTFGVFRVAETAISVMPLLLPETPPAMLGFCKLLLLPIRILYPICFYFYLYRLWEEIPGELARTTPAKAAGFSFIPLFNLYWSFVAFRGLYLDMNKTTVANKLGPRFSTTFITAACIAWIIFPAPGFLAGFVLGFAGAVKGAAPGAVFSNFEYIPLLDSLLNVGFIAVTISAYLITQKKVIEFIDIKSSVGR